MLASGFGLLKIRCCLFTKQGLDEAVDEVIFSSETQSCSADNGKLNHDKENLSLKIKKDITGAIQNRCEKKNLCLQKGVEGKEFRSADRRGKYLILKTDGSGTTLIHLGLTGDVVYQLEEEPEPRFTHAAFYMDGEALYYTDQRKFGKIAFYDTQNADQIPELEKLGPEPLDKNLDYQTFRQIPKHHATDIHKVLMIQEEIAGIGNVYADEISYQAGVRPDRNTDSLSEAEIKKLFDATKSVLQKAVEMDADLTPLANKYIIPHRRTDHLCPGDKTRLKSKGIGGRTSYYCPTHQK